METKIFPEKGPHQFEANSRKQEFSVGGEYGQMATIIVIKHQKKFQRNITTSFQVNLKNCQFRALNVHIWANSPETRIFGRQRLL